MHLTSGLSLTKDRLDAEAAFHQKAMVAVLWVDYRCVTKRVAWKHVIELEALCKVESLFFSMLAA
jgi:hypothetical protein